MYVLHYYPDTASLAVRMVLAELGVQHRCELIDREGGALSSPAYRALQPLGLIPALETPDGTMFETAAILLYLSDRHPGLAPAPDAPDRGDFLKWLFFTSTNAHTTLLQLFYPERTAGPECVPQVLAHALPKMKRFLALLDGAATANPGWLSPDRPTILGYYVAMLMHWLGGFGAEHPLQINAADYPALYKVLTMLEGQHATEAIAEDEGLGPTPFTAPLA
ncbi:glutathione S-transferase family protein [Tabrizicola oligotrophica]|uniref:Glutathione S-transferase family protein n=1 Tax=Tabrizicola oligotrophica TaxID=2710650 RepID=A0A6M0QPS5_9RHOB|nr:glutathione S-transferase family protein [Tabrizicola oligotrophica]NEY89459.1 glutathione S-transferase family protein [Tabrizicola oligotrophica]